jgi:hypothetical protein
LELQVNDCKNVDGITYSTRSTILSVSFSNIFIIFLIIIGGDAAVRGGGRGGGATAHSVVATGCDGVHTAATAASDTCSDVIF